jgi:hypothetical protein
MATNVAKMVMGIYARNLPSTPGNIIIGMKTTIVVSVHAITQLLKSFTANKTAVFGLYPSFIFSAAASIITIVVSIAIHNVRTRLKFVRKLSVYPNVSSTINVIINHIGRPIDAIIEGFRHTKNTIVINTKRIVCKALELNCA